MQFRSLLRPSSAASPQRRVAIVVGASGKIGPAVARALHHAGYSVVAHCSDNVRRIDGLVQALCSIRPGSAAAVAADFRAVPDAAAQQVVDAAVCRFRRVDALVHTASLFHTTPLASATLEDWHAHLNVNAASALFLAQAALPHLARRCGAIVTLCDVNAGRPLANHVVYNASKAALIGVTKSLAKDLAPHGVRVNGINPGAIGPWPEAPALQELKDVLLESTPLGRLGTPEHIADAVLFLLRNEFVTGQILNVDGGMTLNLRRSDAGSDLG